MQQAKLEMMIKKFYESYPQLINNDKALCWYVWYYLGEIKNNTVMTYAEYLHATPGSSIRRAARKVRKTMGIVASSARQAKQLTFMEYYGR